MKRIIFYTLVFLIILCYYNFEYKRHFVNSSDGQEYLTIWQKSNGSCYIIPGKYYSPIVPDANYIKTKNHRNYLGIIWDSKDENILKASLYHEYENHLTDKIELYSNNDSMMLEYGLLKKLDIDKGIRLKSENFDSLKNTYDYKYIDLNRVFGIKEY